MDPLALARGAVWNAGEGRPRAPVRLLGHSVLLVAVLLALGLSLGAALGPDPFDDLSPFAGLVVRLLLVGTAATAASLLAVRLLDHREWGDVGLGGGRAWWRDLVAGLALGAGLQAGIFATSLAAGWTRVEAVAGADLLPWLLAGAALMVAVGFYEELLFRGYYLVNLAEGLRALPLVDARRALLAATALTSLAFGALHGTNPNATLLSSAFVAGYGAYLALGYLLTGDLALPVGFHAAWNYAQGFVFGFPVSGVDHGASLLATETAGPAVLTGGPFGPEAGLVGLAWVAASVPVVLWWLRRTRGGVALRDAIAVPELRDGGDARDERGTLTVADDEST